MTEATKQLKELKKQEQQYLKSLNKQREELDKDIYKSTQIIGNYDNIINYVELDK